MNKKNNLDLLQGDKLFQKRARKVFPYLVREAKAKHKISYSDLAKETNIPNPRNLDYILGFIGDNLNELGRQNKIKIPPIQFIVINKNKGIPGKGTNRFIGFEDFNIKNTKNQKDVFNKIQKEIYNFQKWDWVLEKFNLEPINDRLKELINETKKYKKGGESISHKEFKEYIFNNPDVLGLKNNIEKVQMEYKLLSADSIDILFKVKNTKIGVEVKSNISDETDILRGIFQCVKYKCLIEAEQIIKNEIPNCRVILALQGELPKELLIIKKILDVEIIDNIEIK